MTTPMTYLQQVVNGFKSYLRNEAIALSISQLFYIGAALFVTLATGFWLHPEDVGVWRILSLAEAYVVFATFGLPNGFLRQFPIAKGAADQEGMSVRVKALYFSQFMQTLIGAGILFYLVKKNIALQTSSWLPLAAVFYLAYFVTTRFKVSAETYLRADGRFSILARAYFILAFVRIASIVLIPLFGFVGFLIRWPLTMLIECILLQYLTRLPLASIIGSINVHTLLELGRDGLPLIIISSIGSFSDALDRTWLSSHADVASVGLYFIADSVKMFFGALLGNIALVQYNRCSLAYGLNDSAGIRQSVRSAARLLIVAYLAGTIAVLIGIPILGPILLPAYSLGIPASLVILVGVFGLTIGSLGFPLTVTRRYGWSFAAALCALGVQFGSQVLLGNRMPALVMVATAWSAGQVCSGLILITGVFISLRSLRA